MPRDNKTIQPLHTRLPALTPSLARLTCLLFDQRGAVLAEHLSWSLAPAPAGQALPTDAARLRLQSEHGGLDCEFALAPHPALESAALAPSGQWRAALADALLQPWLQRWQQLGLPALSVSALSPPGADAGHAATGCALATGLALQLRASKAPAPETITLIITDIDAGLLAALEAAPRPQTDLPAWLGTLPLAGAAVIGARRCTPALLATLRRGDVLLGWRGGVGSLATLPGVTLRWGAPQGLHYRAAASIADGAITLDSYPTLSLESDSMEPYTAQDEGATDVAALELPITLEIATMAMPLQQLGAMQPGQVLALPLALADARVRMVACGQVIGHGTLVVVGEQLGFQLGAMVHGNDADA